MPGQGRLGDKGNVPIDTHGCPGCPHPAVGPAIADVPTGEHGTFDMPAPPTSTFYNLIPMRVAGEPTPVIGPGAGAFITIK